MSNHLKIKKLPHFGDLELPFYATNGSSGMDLRAALSESVVLKSGEYQLIPCGFSMEIPLGFEAQIRPRSGLAAKHGITVLNSPGTIDSDYRGEVQVILINHGKNDFIINRGERIAQMIIASYEKVVVHLVDELTTTERGDGGFGHTGKH